MFLAVFLPRVVPDNPADIQVDYNVSVAEIMGGQTRDGNLFHSFQDFTIRNYSHFK